VSDDVRALRDEVALLRRSLDDARAEHARGELDDDSLHAIEHRDVARLELAVARLDALGVEDAGAHRAAAPATPVASTPRRSRRLLVACTLALALAAATIGVVLGRPFAAATPAMRLNTVEKKVAVLLIQAELFVLTGQNARALTAYDAVLRLEPRNGEAFIESGWLHYEAGLLAHRPGEVDIGASMLRRSIALAPGNGASHLYFGVVLLQHFHDPRAARAQVLASAALPESKSEEAITATLLYYFSRH
jgi:tetratricopeptide (TPR) repeat protein